MADDQSQLYRETFLAGGDAPGPSTSGGPTEAARQRLLAAGQMRSQRTLDGDTLDASTGGDVKRLRFAGIDAPESAQGSLGQDAQDDLDKMVQAGGGDLQVGSSNPDPHGRQVSTLYSGGKNLNVALVRHGKAQVYDRYLNQLEPSLQRRLLAAQELAKQEKAGIWADDSGYQNPEDFRREREAELGDAAHAEGHEVRAREDGDDVTDPKQRLALARRARGLGGLEEIPSEGRDGIPADSRYQEGQGFLGHVLDGLDYAGNAGRSFLLGAEQAAGAGKGWGDQIDQGAHFAGQALAKKRATSGTQLKDAITERLGLGKVRMGKDDGQFQLGDLGDWAADTGLDIVTDPITYLTAGSGKLLKVAGGGPGVTKAMTAGRAGLGAVYGYGATPEDASTGEKLLGAAGGATLGVAAPKALAATGDFLRDKANAVTDWYAEATRGSKFADYANQSHLYSEAIERKKQIVSWIVQGRHDALEGLDEVGKVDATNIMRMAKNETVRIRNKIMERSPFREDQLGYDRFFNKATAEANQRVVSTFVPKLLKDQAVEIKDAVMKWADHNENIVGRLNQMFGTTSERAKKSTLGIVGLTFHVDDVGDIKNLKDAEQVLSSFQIHKNTMGKTIQNGLTADQSYAVYAHRFAGNFLDSVSQKAVQYMQEYRQTPALQAPVRGLEKGLAVFDKATNFVKANMLYFSMSWIKNNYFDNLAKAFVEGGAQNLIDTAAMGKLRRGTATDIWKMYKGDVSHIINDPEIKHAARLGVLDNPMFKSMGDEITHAFVYQPDKIARATDSDIGRWVKKGADFMLSSNPVVGAIQNVGSFMEGTARFMTYVNTRKAMMESAAFAHLGEEEIRKAAADVARKAFFDYGDVTALEKATLKRVIPFYSFYSKNLPYWMKATFDPARAGRVVALDKLRRNIGRPVTDEDAKGLTSYVTNNAPRKLKKDEQGNDQYAIIPGSSEYEAIKMLSPKPGDIGQNLLDKVTPMARTAYELATGNDTFTGDKLWASDQKNGRKYLYSRGHWNDAQNKALHALGPFGDMAAQALGVGHTQVDGGGNPYTTSDSDVAIDKLRQTLLPMGFMEQALGSIGKVNHGKENILEAVGNRSQPVTKVKVSPQFRRAVAARQNDGK